MQKDGSFGWGSFVICLNYAWLVRQDPTKEDSYFYIKEILGEDHAFLTAWSLVLAYCSIMWANAAAIALMNGHIAKPIDKDQLLAILSDLFRK